MDLGLETKSPSGEEEEEEAALDDSPNGTPPPSTNSNLTPPPVDNDDDPGDQTLAPPSSIFERQAVRVSNRPCLYFWVAFVVAVVLSFVGLTVGDFEVNVESSGWTSRGTQIADRHSQFILAYLNRAELWSDRTGEVWDDLISNVQPGWETDDEEDDRRRLEETHLVQEKPQHSSNISTGSWQAIAQGERRLPFPMTEDFKRRLQTASGSQVLSGCDINWYENELLNSARLWPIWNTKDRAEPNVLVTEQVLRDICLSEEITQQALIDNDLCTGCSRGCLPPYSIVLFARVTVSNGLFLDCEGLASAWTAYNDGNTDFEQELTQCGTGLAAGEIPESCPEYFTPILIDEKYPNDGVVRYTSSVFASNGAYEEVERMYEIEGDFSRGTGAVEGAYDTQYEDFVNFYIDGALGRDMALALASAFITAIAILVHTRSPLLTVVGVLQIVLSFPLSYFVYTFLGQLDFFPFLNFIGIFVVFALGADDVFVAVDKWKNARLLHKQASTAQIAAIALPDAAGAMFLTTLTTAVAFFGTIICPVAPIKCFAIFVGLLIVMDYINCVLFVFPALCIYDRWRHRKCCCCRCWHCRGTLEVEEFEDVEDAEQHPSLIRRILSAFYTGIHVVRFPMLLVVAAAFTICAIFAAKMDLPTSSDVRLLDSSKNEFELNFEWRKHLLWEVLDKKAGSTAFVIWGVVPSDTGDHINPNSFTQLVLDNKFEPSKEEAQLYLRDFCDNFYQTEWASPMQEDELCPINKFDEWLKEQSSSTSPEWIYRNYCGGATGMPVAEEDFDACLYNWGQRYGEQYILARDGKIEILFFRYNSRVRYDSPYDTLDSEWNAIEDWMKEQRATDAPASANGMYFTSDDYWWYDTNGRMLNTAYTASAIAISTGAVVILFSSRSIVLTIFSTFTIGYVLASTTAVLVAIGWSLGFLEAICFAILIGLSCDFVIHFSHAYASLPGKVDRHERSKFALISMGPSILAAGITTVAAAAVMLFCVISFFTKFGVILFVTIINSTLGSFVIFTVLTDSFGPSDPTHIVDSVAKKLCGSKEQEEDVTPVADEAESAILPSVETKEADKDATVY